MAQDGVRVPVQGDDQQRLLWLAVRRGLLLIVAAIEDRYQLERDRRECAKIATD